MIKAHCKHYKYEKRIVLFSDGDSEIDWRDYKDILEMLSESDIQLMFNAVHLENPKSELEKTNYDQWRTLVSQCPGSHIFDLDDYYEVITSPRPPNVRPTPAFNGFLVIGSVPIAISMYLRIRKVEFPKSHKYSLLGHQTHAVIADRKYWTKPRDENEEKVEVLREELEKVYKYGMTNVKVSKDEEEFAKLKTKKGMYLVKCIPSESIPRHYLYQHPYSCIGSGNNSVEAAKAVSALAHALYETQMIALVRYVSKDDSLPEIGILKPYFEPNISILQYFNIPYADDINDYPRTEKITRQPKPNPLIDELMDELYIPDYSTDEVYNPLLWRLTDSIHQRALDPNAPISEIPSHLAAPFNPPKNLESLGSRLNEFYHIRKVESRNAKVVQEEEIVPIEELLKVPVLSQPAEVTQISYDHPLEDFTAMISNKQTDLVETAVDQICKMMIRLINDNKAETVIQCLPVVRKVAAEEEEAYRYNTMLYSLKSTRSWPIIKHATLGLITCNESVDPAVKTITQDIADNFMNEEEMELDRNDYDIDDLLDMME
ncbi:SPOC like C-terminal domain-containing protein [Pilobolus umbonatus]|nr:SPOC like C-terminal domain-containing protein [Pilobolus umbonatus]